jgi:hypothetical protein
MIFIVPEIECDYRITWPIHRSCQYIGFSKLTHININVTVSHHVSLWRALRDDELQYSLYWSLEKTWLHLAILRILHFIQTFPADTLTLFWMHTEGLQFEMSNLNLRQSASQHWVFHELSEQLFHSRHFLFA